MPIDVPATAAGAQAAAIAGSLRRICEAMQPSGRPAVLAARPAVPPTQQPSAPATNTSLRSPEMTAFPEFGQFNDLEVPGKWLRQSKQAGSPMNSCFLQFKLEDEPQTLLCFFVRGFPLGLSATNALREILAKRPHALDIGERQSILEVLRDKSPAKDFKFTSLRTIDIDGKRVLSAEGVFTLSSLHAATLFVDSGEGTPKCTIEELAYIAPRNSYYLHYADVIRSFSKLTWSAAQRAALFK